MKAKRLLRGVSPPRILGIATVLVVLGLGGCERTGSSRPLRIAFIGDSITQGIYKGRLVDEQGGYPGRLQRRVAARATILNRGLGGSSTHEWSASPRGGDLDALWQLLRKLNPSARLPRQLPADASSLLEAVLRADRPDVAILGLGANDMSLASFHGDPPVESEQFIVRMLGRLRELERLARRFSSRVLVSTILPSHRDPREVRRRLNREIHAAFAEVLPLGERFEDAEWPELLSDPIYPNRAGYEYLAAVLELELERRGLLAPMPSEEARP